jgi:hypothetical protein
LLVVLASSAAAEYLCGVKQRDGTVALVPCCDFRDGASSDECKELASIASGGEVKILQELVSETRRKRVARYLRKNPNTTISFLRIEQPPFIELTAVCCDCKPHTNFCTDGGFNNCESPSSSGLCPSDKERWLCTDFTTEECTSLD